MSKIILAEDEAHISKLIEYKLAKEGHSVTTAKNGKEALELLNGGETWSLVILDVMMPFHDGWEVLREFRARDAQTPVLMLTAKGSELDRAKSVELGATRFLRKPFDPAELADVVRETACSGTPIQS